MTSYQPRVALIIVAYGHAATLPATLSSVQSLAYPEELREIIVVENGDGSCAELARPFPGVAVLEPGRNLGFAGGCNLGVAHSAADVVVLINPDLEPQPSFLKNLVAPLADPRVGVVGAKLLFPDEQRIQHAGAFLEHSLALGHHYGYDELAQGQFDVAQEVEFVTGAAMALRRETWERCGGMDEAFFPAYYEEVDLCWRLREQGFVIRYEPSAVALHQEAAALGKRSPVYHLFYHRNRLRLLFKHRSNEWLAAHWLTAELAHVRAAAEDAEIDSLIDAYHSWQQAFVAGRDPAEQPQSQPRERAHLSELEWTVQQVAAKRVIEPITFRSRLPLVSRLRTWFNRVATEEYLRPLIQQQNDYNAAVAELAMALERQRRASDAAVLCQGMFLAKLLDKGSSQH